MPKTSPNSNKLRPRHSPKKHDPSMSWEEQKQLEKALIASLYDKSKNNTAPEPSSPQPSTSSTASNRENNPLYRAVRKSAANWPRDLDVSKESEETVMGKPVVTVNPAELGEILLSTDHLIRYICFKGTKHMPDCLKYIDDIPLEKLEAGRGQKPAKIVRKLY